MRSAKSIGRSPREVAEELAAKVISLDEVESAEVAGPGFLNLRVSDAFFLAALSEIGDGYGGGWVESPERVQVEMVSANPTGPVVVSAARNGAYGDCVARLLAFAGHDVSREYYYNDAAATEQDGGPPPPPPPPPKQKKKKKKKERKKENGCAHGPAHLSRVAPRSCGRASGVGEACSGPMSILTHPGGNSRSASRNSWSWPSRSAVACAPTPPGTPRRSTEYAGR